MVSAFFWRAILGRFKHMLFIKIAYKATHSIFVAQHGTIRFSESTPIYMATNLAQIRQ